MQDVPQERSDAEAPPSGKAMSPVRFAGLVFDLGACTLARELGEAIRLTRGEFRLLRLFTVQDWANINWSDNPQFQREYAGIVEGLRKASLPEGEAKKD